MELITYFQALLLGIVEGLTEFIPVSSTGHLILLVDILGFEGPKGKVFEIVIQLGAILAICFVYWQKLLHVTLTLPTDKTSQIFARNIIIAFLPAAIIGVFAHSFIKEVLFSPLVVSVTLIIGGIAILFIEKYRPKAIHHDIDKMTWKLALSIGLCQCLAMIPGTSRSGATIMGALLLRTDRKVATEFSFFLAIPTMLGATVYDVYKNYEYLSFDNIAIIAIGFISAFLAALLVVRSLIAFISTHGFTPFAWYRIALGGIMLTLLPT